MKPEAWIEAHRSCLNTVGNRAFGWYPWGTTARPCFRVSCYCAQAINVPTQAEAERLCKLGERPDDAGLFPVCTGPFSDAFDCPVHDPRKRASRAEGKE